MKNTKTTSEVQSNHTEISVTELAAISVPMVKPYTPGNGSEQKRAFLNGEVAFPRHTYPNLQPAIIKSYSDAITSLRAKLSGSSLKKEVFREAYENILDDNALKVRMLEITHELQVETRPEIRDALLNEYMEINIRVYGEPEREVYDALVAKSHELIVVDLPDEYKVVANELSGLLPPVERAAELFKPQPETVKWVANAAKSVYGNMLECININKSEYTSLELRDLFEQIIRDVYGAVADEWEVVLSPDASSIEVSRQAKQVIIPENSMPRDIQKVRELVVHELGVHLLKAITGEQTDMPLLSSGLAGNVDSEEGLATVMGHVIDKGYEEPGTGLYLAASLAYFENKGFSEVFEILWRRTLLEQLNADEDIAAATKRAQDNSYNVTRRIFRGTEEVPWFKDLSYLRGNQAVWKYLESIRGDEMQFTYILMGKYDPTKSQDKRVFFESSSV